MDLVQFAYTNGLSVSRSLPRAEQKRLGQFMTPPPIARLMANRACRELLGPTIRVLEPAAGAGILVAAVMEALLSRPERPVRVELALWEIDARLGPILHRLAGRLRRAGRAAGIQTLVSVRVGDFLLSGEIRSSSNFDLVIANPPYFKINKSDARAVRHSYAVFGQPNIYGLFMAASARLLAPGGHWCFITPRSWTNGQYFVGMRRELLRCLEFEAIHVFESREEHFTDDEILQEAMIVWAVARCGHQRRITLSSSQGIEDLDRARLRAIPAKDVIGNTSDAVIYLPTASGRRALGHLNCTAESLGIKVSTGPVVAFRASEHLAESHSRNTVPLLWMQHIAHMRISWPIQKKREHMAANASTAWMLLPNATMVITRRFSPKEDPRRITAAAYIGGTLPGSCIGLENHVNYLYRPGGRLSAAEALGLAAYLNSSHVDTYLRTVAGNTQVNAADLRGLPLPPIDTIVKIGEQLNTRDDLNYADRIVDTVLGEWHATRRRSSR